MKGKKVISMIITGALVLAPGTAAFADTTVARTVTSVARAAVPVSSSNLMDESNVKVSKDEAKSIALQKLKELLGIEIDEKKFESRIELLQDYEYKKGFIWQINFSMFNNEKSIHNDIQLDANTGKIIGISNNEFNHGTQNIGISKITEEQAKEEAENFLKKSNPVEFKQATLMEIPRYNNNPGNYPVTYGFQYVRIMNGIEFDRNFIAVGVNGETGKVTSYTYRWNDDLVFPDAEGVVSQEKAGEIFRNEAEVSLAYMAMRDKFDYSGKVENVKLIYSPDFSKGFQLDAKEGTMLSFNSNKGETPKIKDITPERKAALADSAKESDRDSREMDTESASVIIKEKVKELVGDGYEVDSLRYIESNNYWETYGRKAWSASFYKKDTDMRGYYDGGQITIDATNKEIINFYKNFYNEEVSAAESNPSVTWEQAYEKAIEMVAKNYPNKITNIRTEQTHIKSSEIINGKDIGERFYYFNFSRTINGIPYQDNGIYVTYDSNTGAIRDLRYMWDEGLEFQDVKGAISKEEAERAFFNYNKPELSYTIINNNENNGDLGIKVKLVYTLRSNKMIYAGIRGINAFTGKVIDYAGDEINIEGNGFKDRIKGHWAEKELEILAAHGIIEAGEFDPDKKISRLDAIKMVVNAKGYTYNMQEQFEDLNFNNIDKNDKNYKYLQMAVKYGIIKNEETEFKGDELITREQMAEILVRLLQYEKLAKVKDIFVLSFTDVREISEDKYGFVAIGKGLGILEGSDGKFRPKDEVTSAEFAVAIYKALASISE